MSVDISLGIVKSLISQEHSVWVKYAIYINLKNFCNYVLLIPLWYIYDRPTDAIFVSISGHFAYEYRCSLCVLHRIISNGSELLFDAYIPMASQITSLTIVYSTVYLGADQRQHESSASLAASPVIDEFPAQMSSYAENASIWWRHHVIFHEQIFINLCQQKEPQWYNVSKTENIHRQVHIIKPKYSGQSIMHYVSNGYGLEVGQLCTWIQMSLL